MKKIINLAEIEAREKELVDELGKLRAIKKYAIKYGSDLAIPPVPIGRPSDEVSALTKARIEAVSQLNVSHHASNRDQPSPDLMKALRDIIHNFGDEVFSYPKIEEMFELENLSFSRSSVFDGIATLKDSGEIEVIAIGAGRRAAQYRATAKFQPVESEGIPCEE